MSDLWLMDFAWPPADGAVAPDTSAGVVLWQSVDGQLGRAYYASGRGAPGADWVRLHKLQSLDGASASATVTFHYVVETDVALEHEGELNAWYEQEHLPGLASVPGTIRAVRYRRDSGSPRYLACYDLTSPDTLNRPEWLAVRHTDWSSKVRPTFQNTRRTMFRQPVTGAA